MKRRIFIAIDLPPELKQKIAEAIKQWQWLPIRWLAQESWHITLVPPAYLEGRELEILVAALRRHRLGGQFAVQFSEVTLAPPGVPARMIWLEGETPLQLVELASKIDRTWKSLGSLPQPKQERRPIHLHATLARFESGELQELEAKTRVLGEVDFRFEAQEIAVMESHLKPTGAEYETLAVIPLAA